MQVEIWDKYKFIKILILLDCPESYVVRTKTNDVYLVEKPRTYQKIKKKKVIPEQEEQPESYVSGKN